MSDPAYHQPLSRPQRLGKRTLDIAVALVGLVLTWPLILVGYVVASVETRSSGLYVQQRVGWRGRYFPLVKVRTMRSGSEALGTWTARGDPRVTRSGALMRRWKIDELPQLFNVLVGHMSLVGPRPDVPGFADELTGEDRLVLSVRPGITGPATLKFRDEESMLARHEMPAEYNRTVLFPAKVRVNLEYVRSYSLRRDFRVLLETVRVTLRGSAG